MTSPSSEDDGFHTAYTVKMEEAAVIKRWYVQRDQVEIGRALYQ